MAPAPLLLAAAALSAALAPLPAAGIRLHVARRAVTADSCTTRLVTDGARCGWDTMRTVVEDALACGWSTCHRMGVPFPCPARCDREDHRPKSCEVLAVCHFVLRVKFAGQLYVGTFGNMSVSAEYIDHHIVEGAEEVRALVEAEKRGDGGMVRGIIEDVIGQATRHANAQIRQFQAGLSSDISARVGDKIQLAGEGSIVGDVAQALNETLQALLPTTRTTFSREEIPTGLLDGTGLGRDPGTAEVPGSCRRIMRVDYDSGELRNRQVGSSRFPVHLAREIVRVRTRDGCLRVYTADCAVSRLDATTVCAQGNVTERNVFPCIWGGWGCLSTVRRITLGRGESATVVLPEGPVELRAGTISLSTLVPRFTPGNVTALVSIPNFEGVFTETLCRRRVAGMWYVIGRLARETAMRTCRASVAAMMHIGLPPTMDVPMPAGVDLDGMNPHARTRFQGPDLTALLRELPWKGIERYIERTAVEMGKDLQPAQIVGSRMVLKGSGEHLLVEEGSWIDVAASVDLATLAVAGR